MPSKNTPDSAARAGRRRRRGRARRPRRARPRRRRASLLDARAVEPRGGEMAVDRIEGADGEQRVARGRS